MGSVGGNTTILGNVNASAEFEFDVDEPLCSLNVYLMLIVEHRRSQRRRRWCNFTRRARESRYLLSSHA